MHCDETVEAARAPWTRIQPSIGISNVPLILFSATMTPQSMPARVLVVDDDAMSRELLGVLLEAEGYAVECADSGEAALELISRNEKPPDVILADIQMPGITGARLAGRLRTACGPRTLLLAMSGSQPPSTAISRFDGFLLKPFKMGEIASALLARTENLVSADPSASDASARETAPSIGVDAQVQREAVDPVSTSESPVLNEKIYRQLARAMPAQQLQEMYALCVNDARERIAVMRAMVAANDNPSVSREAHAIKGSCGMLGATQLHGMAAEIERISLETAGSEPRQSINFLDELSSACDRLERMLGSRV